MSFKATTGQPLLPPLAVSAHSKVFRQQGKTRPNRPASQNKREAFIRGEWRWFSKIKGRAERQREKTELSHRSLWDLISLWFLSDDQNDKKKKTEPQHLKKTLVKMGFNKEQGNV